MDPIERLEFQGSNLTLVADAMGPQGGVPILFLHGGGQTRRSWRKAVGQAARHGYRAFALDLRGHGDSGWAADGDYALTAFVADLEAVLGQFEVPPVVVGASLGGLASMLAAARVPERMRALVLVDITARLEPEGVQEVLGFMRSATEGFASLDEAADAVAAYLPHRPRPRDTSGLAYNLRLRDGRYYWHWDPAFMRIGRGADNSAALEAAARALTLPVLLVRGGRSRIVSDASASAFLEMVPHAEHANISDAHHMVAGDANDAFNGAIFGFVARQAAATPAP